MPLPALSAAIDELIAEGPDTLADGESMIGLRRELARFEAVIATATARFDTSREWEADGAQTAAAWLAWQCHLPKAVTRRQVSLGRKLRHLPACEQAWLDGDITAHHVGVIGAVRRPTTEQALARDEKLLVDNAKHLRFDAFNRVVDYWAQRADPDGAEDHDRYCDVDTCDRPADDCQVDHLTPYSQGGPTTQANGRLGCAYPNRLWFTRGP